MRWTFPRVLRNRQFVALWLGLVVSSVGDWINYVAMVSLVYGRTHSAGTLVALRLFHIVPILLFAPFAGVFVDRWHRKHTLVLSSFVAAICVAVMAFAHPLPVIYGAYGAITIAMMFFNPALTASLPNIVHGDDLVAANTLSQITSTASIVAGGLIGGTLVAGLGPSAAFLVDAVSFLVIGVVIGTIRLVDTRAGLTASTVRRELVHGIQYLAGEHSVANVVVSGAIFVFATASVLTLGIAFARGVLHAGTLGYGELVAGMGAGSLLGAVTMIALRDRIREDVAFAVSGILLGCAVATMGLATNVLTAATAYGVAGFAGVINAVAAVTLIQRRVPDGVRGRIFAVSSTIDHAGAFASALLIGFAAAVGTARLITVSGLLAAGAGLISLAVVARVGEPAARRTGA